jgi:quinol monooxygenase YgiN
MIVLAAKFLGKPERRGSLISLAATVAKPSRAEAGCVSYNFYEQQPTSNEFLFFEEWTDQAALDYHFQTSHFKKFMEQFPELIQGPANIRVYEVSQASDL